MTTQELLHKAKDAKLSAMLLDTEMKNRVMVANEQKIPITNYGTAIAHMNGILERSIKIINGRS